MIVWIRMPIIWIKMNTFHTWVSKSDMARSLNRKYRVWVKSKNEFIGILKLKFNSNLVSSLLFINLLNWFKVSSIHLLFYLSHIIHICFSLRSLNYLVRVFLLVYHNRVLHRVSYLLNLGELYCWHFCVVSVVGVVPLTKHEQLICSLFLPLILHY